jgi:hypothetical protein
VRRVRELHARAERDVFEVQYVREHDGVFVKALNQSMQQCSWRAIMYGNSGPSELGYASAAVIAALLDKLIQKGVISRPDVVELLHDAVKTMSIGQASAGVAGGMRIINESIVPRIDK